MELMVNRDVFTETSSLGQLFLDDQFQCYTLEDKLRQIDGCPVEVWKVPGETAIPYGRYKVELRYSKRFDQLTPHVLGVEGFTDIEIHPGNSTSDTEGCILVGTQRTTDLVLNSREAFGLLMAKLENTQDPIYLTIA